MKRKNFIKNMKALNVERNAAALIARKIVRHSYVDFLRGYSKDGEEHPKVTNALITKDAWLFRIKHKENLL